ncbi:U1 small nuclear ribonucleoprotein 70 kDa-like protein [Pseudozyma hubeiensis]|nr:U1 small nuclear ribonucleoprotein 70 kDa-like protein [Pseudozyma hubeiensis]
MTHLLPPSLIRLFAPRPPLEYVAPIRRFDPDPHSPPLPKDPSRISRRKTVRSPLTGVASFLERVKQETADRGETTDDIALSSSSSTLTLSRATLREIELEKSRSSKSSLKQHHLSTYSPTSNPDATSDPYKTLFLARLSYDTTESDLHKEFDMYGPIEAIKLVRDKEGKSRGYAFIAYERERDMKAAYKDAEGIKINGRRIMVDVERGRTVKDWKPMRLGGGLGGSSRKPKKAPEPLDPTPSAGGFHTSSSGGFRGRGASNGFRGGSRGGGFSQRGGFRGGFNNGPRNNFAPPPPQQRGYRDYPPNNNYQQRPYDDPSAPPAKRSRY